VKATEADMRWWLRNFNDVELASIATDLVGHIISPDGIRNARGVLTASADKDKKE
jgi:hypothetical protein